MTLTIQNELHNSHHPHNCFNYCINPYIAKSLRIRTYFYEELELKINNFISNSATLLFLEEQGQCLKWACEDKPPCPCHSIYEPVCGADGRIYDNECRAVCDNIRGVKDDSNKGLLPTLKHPLPYIY